MINPYDCLIDESFEGIFLKSDSNNLQKVWNNELATEEIRQDSFHINFDDKLFDLNSKEADNSFNPNNIPNSYYNAMNFDLRGKLSDHILIFAEIQNFLNFLKVLKKYTKKRVVLVNDINFLEEEFCKKNEFIFLRCNYTNLNELMNTNIENSSHILILNDEELELADIIDENFKNLDYTMYFIISF